MFYGENGKTISIAVKYAPIPHRIGGNQKRSEQSTTVDHKLIETVFLIAICRQSSDKWQSKTLFTTIFFIYVRR